MSIERLSIYSALLWAPLGVACGLECGPGTVDIDDSCVPGDQACGAGTQFDASTRQCMASNSGSLSCGAGTRVENGTCVPAVGQVTCATGTVLSAAGDSCEPAPAACGAGSQFDVATRTCIGAGSVTCGPGTAEVAGECRPSTEACGPGTVFSPVTNTCIRGEAFFGDCAEPMAIEGDNQARINGDVVLAAGGCFEVTREITVSGSIRVEPGVQLVFQENAGFLVSGIFSARGTEMSPIVLRGAASSPGYWNGLQYTNSESEENVLEHVVIRDGG